MKGKSIRTSIPYPVSLGMEGKSIRLCLAALRGNVTITYSDICRLSAASVIVCKANSRHKFLSRIPMHQLKGLLFLADSYFPPVQHKD
jgi:hypothetical protein